MKKILLALIILAMLAIDWLTFHDFLKGEHYNFVQYLTGVVSIPLFVILGKDLLQNKA